MSTKTAPGRRRGQRLLRGGLIVAASSVLARAASFGAQLILGRLLLPEDFGVYAIALTFATVAAAANSVLRSYLVDAFKRKANMSDLFRLIGLVTVGATAVLVALSPLVAASFDEPGLGTVLGALILIAPIQVTAAFGAALLTVNLRYHELSVMWIVSAVLRQVVTVAGALAGAGAMSFVLGALVGSVAELAVVRAYSGPFPSWRRGRARRAVSDGVGLAILPLAIVVLALWINGDYASAGLFESAAVVGTYFFAYQITAALSQPFSLAVSSVLLPSFARAEDGVPQSDAFRLTVMSVPLASGMAFGVLAVLAAPLTHVIWGSKWDLAAGPIVVLAAATPMKLLLATCLSILQARGDWAGYTRMLAAAAGTAMLAAAVGGFVGGLSGLVGFMAVTIVLQGMAAAAVVGRSFGLSVVESLWRPALAWSVWVLGLVFSSLSGSLTTITIADGVVRLIIFTLASLPMAYVLFGDDVRFLWVTATGRGRRIT